MTNFGEFIHEIEQQELPIKVTANGSHSIEQTPRNKIRMKGMEALFADLMDLYGDEFDIVRTEDGIILVGENEPNDITFSWELKSTIKSVDFDPFMAANNYEQELSRKEEAKQAKIREKEQKETALALKRQKKLDEIAARQAIYNKQEK